MPQTMRTRLLLLLLLLCPFVLSAQVPPDIDWTRTLGGSGNDQAYAVVCAQDGGYLVVSAKYIAPGNDDILVTKLDATGATEWEQNYGGSSYDYPSSALQNGDGSYMIAGYTRSNNGDVSGNHGDYDIWLFKLDPSGSLLWQKCYGGPLGDGGGRIVAASGPGYWIIGSSGPIGGDVTTSQGSGDVWLIRIDLDGAILWQRSYGGSGSDGGADVIETVDGGCLLLASTGSSDGDVSNNAGGIDVWLIKLAIDGTIVWEKSYGGSGIEYPRALGSNNSSGWLFSSSTTSTNGDVSFNHGSIDFWSVAVDTNGTLLWERSFGGAMDESIPFLAVGPVGNIYLAGNTSSTDGDISTPLGGSDLWLVKVTPAGNLIWDGSFGGSAAERLSAFTLCGDGSLVMGGTSNSTDGDVQSLFPGFDAWVVKLLPDLSPVPEHALGPNLQLYPNPTADELVIAPQLARTDQALIELMDAQGRLVRTVHNGLLPADADPLRISLAGLATGSYGVRITAHGQRFTRYVVKL